MARVKVTPTQKEIILKEEDFIVSKTDLKSKILYGNEIFIQMSGYTEAELLGKPHNILRHPDMPKCAFKVLYDHIQQENKEWFGFVKNLRKDGGYYWVFANISPTFDASGQKVGYYSVRRKPREGFKNIIEPLYQELKRIEESGGMQASLKAVEDLLNSKGLTFNELMIKIQKGIINEL
ncbi:PAS domain-containing protein [Caminibacter pacificus]|jgi:PAS domain S-box-containing protein|uniref:PAS domain S-box-containing protein n=1 Tax=Caminibacter pacificus TaxID=1424653 RepID=A0AAJ4UXE2_9BACT|nr:PAS domain-containing protein [Caminibacter pacificus]NPA88400.1 PAS domain-containing protein [Campylobacterota bacterium]QCI28790.1 PAS domain-containing protein [Caminibacter pacificus]ROR39378.1 PAS domain S-box-containing protein [Caminibacter pacificus]